MNTKEKLYYSKSFIQPGRNIKVKLEDSIAKKESDVNAEIKRLTNKKGLDTKSFDKNLTFYPMTQCWQLLEPNWKCCMCFATKREVYENTPNKMIAITINCHHVFCAERLARWFRKDTKCPLCRLDFK